MACGFKEMVRQLHAAFSDFELIIEDFLAEGDRVAARWTCTGTQVGEFMGIPASGNRITITGVEIDRIAGGRIVESWTQVDMAGLLVQAGVLTLPRA